MDFSTNHFIKVGDIVKSEDGQIAIADTHEIWEHDPQDIRKGKLKVVGKATIRILSGGDSMINTNRYSSRGVVCFLPEEYKGCGILAIRVTRIYNKSVEAIPIDYLQNDKPLDWLWHGETAITLLQQKTDYPNLKRITKEGDIAC